MSGLTILGLLDNCRRILQLTQDCGIGCEVTPCARLWVSASSSAIPEDKVAEVANALSLMGFREISIADSVGVVNPVHVRRLITRLKQNVPQPHYSLHFHNTRGLGLVNVLAGIVAGVDAFDSSCGGLGGRPVVPGGRGNISTEDLADMLEEIGICTGIDLDLVVTTAAKLQQFLQRPLASYVLDIGHAEALV